MVAAASVPPNVEERSKLEKQRQRHRPISILERPSTFGGTEAAATMDSTA